VNTPALGRPRRHDFRYDYRKVPETWGLHLEYVRWISGSREARRPDLPHGPQEPGTSGQAATMAALE